MNERERLIELLNEATDIHGIYLDKIAKHLLENGVILPPCKVGDTVYKVIHNNEPLGIAEYIVEGFHFGKFTDNLGHKRKNYLIVKYRTNCLLHHIPFDAIGETVFFNKEEAKQVLKEGKHEVGNI